MYQFVGKTAPFLILACLALGDGCKYINFLATNSFGQTVSLIAFSLFFFLYWYVLVLQLLVLQPAIAQQEDEPPSVKELLMDPYIIVAAG